MKREIRVFGSWQELGKPQLMGSLRVEVVHGKETYSFEYCSEWLNGGFAVVLDPQLRLFQGPQYSNDRDQPNFGMFLDSSPDRWGRLLMKRREAHNARREGRPPQTLLGSDYLLGVHDEQRMGGLRFKTELNGEFLSDAQGQNAPPWARLRELENAARKFQSDRKLDDDETREGLRLLMAPGSSIGGARPKAGVCDDQQNLWIAKFPGRNDEFDIGGWEFVVHGLAVNAGITVADAMVDRLGRPHHTFMVRRFDRALEEGCRVRKHFASAMTMLGYSDGASFRDGASYLEMVEFLMRHGADSNADMHELWRRVVFSICVSNCDDHLRNHGFLLQPNGWKLSPAYDINPDPTGTGLSLNISDEDNSLDLDLALEVAGYFRLSDGESKLILSEVADAVRGWRAAATTLGISRGEQEAMARAFRAVERL